VLHGGPAPCPSTVTETVLDAVLAAGRTRRTPARAACAAPVAPAWSRARSRWTSHYALEPTSSSAASS
jgi:hypothetical protein